MTLVKNILMDTEKGIFINILTGVKLKLEREGNEGRLIKQKIIEEDERRAFQENMLDITSCKKLKPTKSEINLFKIFISEYIKANKLFENLKIVE